MSYHLKSYVHYTTKTSHKIQQEISKYLEENQDVVGEPQYPNPELAL